jgi:AcrR family transcriptional regulator
MVAADTRRRIITATNELFRRHGYNGTTLSEVSAAAPATIGSIYHFFPGGKEALAVAVIESTGVAYRELFEAIAAESDGAESTFANFFEGAASVLIETDFIDPCPIGTVAREVASTSEPVRKAAEAAFDSWIRSASDLLVSAGIEPLPAARLATLFVTTTEGSFVLCRTKRSTEPLDAVAKLLVPLVSSAIEHGSRTPSA